MLGHCWSQLSGLIASLLKDIRQLEAVQRRFTKHLLVMHAFTYPERLKLLGSERLEERRIRADILFVYIRR